MLALKVRITKRNWSLYWEPYERKRGRDNEIFEVATKLFSAKVKHSAYLDFIPVHSSTILISNGWIRPNEISQNFLIFQK